MNLAILMAAAQSYAPQLGPAIGRGSIAPDWPEVLSEVAGRLRTSDLPRLTIEDLRQALGPPNSGTKTRDPGVIVRGVCSVLNSPGAQVALFTFEDTSSGEASGCLAQIRIENGRVTAKPLQIAVDPGELVTPQQAAQVSGQLVIQGLSRWEGNCPRAAAIRLQWTNGRWAAMAQVEAEFESWGTDKLKLTTDGKSLQPVKVSSTAAPENLPFCHATSLRSFIEEWDMGEYGPRLKWKHPQETPYNTLDRLFERRQDLLHVGSICSSPEVARQIVALADHPEDLADTWFVSAPDPNATTVGVLNLRTAFHFIRKGGKWVVDRISSIPSSASGRAGP